MARDHSTVSACSAKIFSYNDLYTLPPDALHFIGESEWLPYKAEVSRVSQTVSEERPAAAGGAWLVARDAGVERRAGSGGALGFQVLRPLD